MRAPQALEVRDDVVVRKILQRAVAPRGFVVFVDDQSANAFGEVRDCARSGWRRSAPCETSPPTTSTQRAAAVRARCRPTSDSRFASRQVPCRSTRRGRTGPSDATRVSSSVSGSAGIAESEQLRVRGKRALRAVPADRRRRSPTRCCAASAESAAPRRIRQMLDQRRPAGRRDCMGAEPDVQRIGGHHVRAGHAEPRGVARSTVLSESTTRRRRETGRSSLPASRPASARSPADTATPRTTPGRRPSPRRGRSRHRLLRAVNRVVEPILGFEEALRIVIDLLRSPRDCASCRDTAPGCRRRRRMHARRRRATVPRRRRRARSNAPAEARESRSSATKGN